MMKVTLMSMGPLTEWGPGQIAPVAPPLSAALLVYCSSVVFVSYCTQYVSLSNIISPVFHEILTEYGFVLTSIAAT